MLTTKNKRASEKWTGIFPALHFLALLAVVVALAGCSPAGTHAFLKGKKLLDEGDYADAVDEFKSASDDMGTNAEVWNYLGVAEAHTGQAEDAAKAYQRALELDRDLTEAHYNLGCLWLDQNKPEDAVNEFTAYTLRRPDAPEGWLKLGLAQLRAQDVLPAEKSFSTALSLSPNNAEALNGMGLARMQRNRPEDAEKFFQAAVRYHPDYAPAILNLATVAHVYLRDDRLALEQYQAYLAFQPRPPQWDAVNAIVTTMEQSQMTPAAPPRQMESTQPMRQNVYAEQRQSETRQQETRPQETRSEETQTEESRQQTQRSDEYLQPPRENYVPPREETQTVRVQPETPIVTAQNVASSQTAAPQPVREPDMFASVEPNPPKPAPDYNPLHWFHSSPTQDETKVTPLPPGNSLHAEPPRPVHIVQPAPPAYASYLYLSPHKPASGDRRRASTMFARAQQFEQQRKYTDALDSYRLATRADPGWFEAQYNCGVLAYRLRDYQFALESYEMALAIEPDSADARYNFALALKAMNYVPDAAKELRRILAAHPENVRAHLELGNIYSQELYDVPHAREQYLKVLQLDPGNAQASNIQFWLSANPQ
jgi:tetratricopeptide (TPR) repeat protein